MALVLTLTADDNDFYVDKNRFVISSISINSFTITREHDGASFRAVDDGSLHEIMPSVFMRFGARAQNAQARVAITAPVEIKILRGENHRAQGGHKPR